MTKEEEEIFEKVVKMRRENELLMVIYEEVNDLVKSGYDGPFMGEEVRGIFYAINEYNKWKRDEQRRKETTNT